MRTIKLSVQQAKSLHEKDNSFRDTLLSEFTDVELGIIPKLKSWGELKYVKGFILNSYADSATPEELHATLSKSRGIYATEKQALSALAMAQLSQLMADLGDECDVDWTNTSTKFTISRYGGRFSLNYTAAHYEFLAFKTEEVREAFLEKHAELINQYFMI